MARRENIERRTLLALAAGLASAIATFCGARAWIHEVRYSAENPASQLTDVLQTLAAGLFWLGLAGLLVAYLLLDPAEDE